MNDNLPAVEMRVPKRRGQIDHGQRVKTGRDFRGFEHSLQIRQGSRKETGIGGSDQERRITQLFAPNSEWQKNQFLFFQPGECLLPDLFEGDVEQFLEFWLVGFFIVPDHHTVGIPPAHVFFRVVDGKAVLAAGDRRFQEKTFAFDFIGHFEYFLATGSQLKNFFPTLRTNHPLRGLQDVFDFLGDFPRRPQFCHHADGPVNALIEKATRKANILSSTTSRR